MDRVKVALIGYGNWGPNLARNFHQLPNADLIMCCDTDPKAMAKAKELYPHISCFQDYTEILQDPDVNAVAIATPAETHYQLAKEALLRGKHTFVEKPLTMEVSTAQEIVKIAKGKGLVLMVGHVYEHHPAVHKIRALLKEGVLGEPLYMYTTRVNLGRVQNSLNVLWSIGPHDVSIALSLFGELPIEVSARGASYLEHGVEDVVFLTMTFPNGVLVHSHVSWLDPTKERRVTLVGRKKMVVFDELNTEAMLKVYDKGVIKDFADVFGLFHYRLHSGDIFIPKLSMSEPLRIECNHFVECIQKGDRPLSDGEAGVRVVKVLEATHCSLKQNGIPVRV